MSRRKFRPNPGRTDKPTPPGTTSTTKPRRNRPDFCIVSPPSFGGCHDLP